MQWGCGWERVAPLWRSAEHTPRLCFQGRVCLPSQRYSQAPAACEAVSWPTGRVHSHTAGCQVWLASGRQRTRTASSRGQSGAWPHNWVSKHVLPGVKPAVASHLPFHGDLTSLNRCQPSRCLASPFSAEFRPRFPSGPHFRLCPRSSASHPPHTAPLYSTVGPTVYVSCPLDTSRLLSPHSSQSLACSTAADFNWAVTWALSLPPRMQPGWCCWS